MVGRAASWMRISLPAPRNPVDQTRSQVRAPTRTHDLGSGTVEQRPVMESHRSRRARLEWHVCMYMSVPCRVAGSVENQDPFSASRLLQQLQRSRAIPLAQPVRRGIAADGLQVVVDLRIVGRCQQAAGGWEASPAAGTSRAAPGGWQQRVKDRTGLGLGLVRSGNARPRA